jgi:hypothetical protein
MSERARELHREGDEHYRAGRYAAALGCWRAALDFDPRNPALHFNVGNALRYLRRRGEAVAAYDTALAIAPKFAMAHHNKATCLLQLGDYPAGFREYEWRKACPGFEDDARYRLPRPWRGEDLRGRTLYIYRELYQGDLLQFGRYARVAEMLGARVILSAPPVMHALLRSMSPTLELVDDAAEPPPYDFQSALLTLPAMFGTTLATVPSWPAYLAAEPERVARWRGRIGPEGFRVGIAWQGSALATQRSFPLVEAVAGFGRLRGVRLISLQKHNGLEQLDALAPGSVETLGEDFDPGPDAFLDTAAAMMACDLFVTPDTSVVHVAGGLGVRTWLALPCVGDWRWREEQADTPWYPSVRIFRQPQPDDWAAVFEAMASVVAAEASAGGSR